MLPVKEGGGCGKGGKAGSKKDGGIIHFCDTVNRAANRPRVEKASSKRTKHPTPPS